MNSGLFLYSLPLIIDYSHAKKQALAALHPFLHPVYPHTPRSDTHSCLGNLEQTVHRQVLELEKRKINNASLYFIVPHCTVFTQLNTKYTRTDLNLCTRSTNAINFSRL